MELTLLSLLSAAILTWLFTCLALWIWALRRVASGHEILDSEPRAACPCGVPELLIALGVYVLVGAGLRPLLLPSSSADDFATAEVLVPLIALNSAATLSSVAAVLVWTSLLRTDPRRMGIVPRPVDLLIGVVATLMLLPPVYAIQGVLSSLIEYRHPLLELLQQPQPWVTMAALAVSSTLVAPLTEEFFFRGLLQGWLSRLAGVGKSTSGESSPGETADDFPATQGAGRESTPVVADMAGGEPPYKPPAPLVAEASRGRPWWPAVLSSIAFALVHFGQGPAPITLFFLSLGIGYLYRQTGRIWAGVVVHMLLNGITTATTIAATLAG